MTSAVSVLRRVRNHHGQGHHPLKIDAELTMSVGMLARHIMGEHFSLLVQHRPCQPGGSAEKHVLRLLLGMAEYVQVKHGMSARLGDDLLNGQEGQHGPIDSDRIPKK